MGGGSEDVEMETWEVGGARPLRAYWQQRGRYLEFSLSAKRFQDTGDSFIHFTVGHMLQTLYQTTQSSIPPCFSNTPTMLPSAHTSSEARMPPPWIFPWVGPWIQLKNLFFNFTLSWRTSLTIPLKILYHLSFLLLPFPLHCLFLYSIYHNLLSYISVMSFIVSLCQ